MTLESVVPGQPYAESDEDLMQRLGRGDRAALAALVERHQTHVLSLAQRFTGHRDTAEDIAQDAFVRVYRAAPTYRPEARFTTWLYRLVVNLCWDRRRRAAREQRYRAGQREQRQAETPSAALDQRERAVRVQRAVQTLPDRQRLAVVLHRYQGLSHREIAEITGWSPGAVESCLVRAYESLRRALADLRS